jgi:hypothetical protein
VLVSAWSGSVRPKLERLTGFRGLYLLRRRQADEIEFLVHYEVLAAPDDAG